MYVLIKSIFLIMQPTKLKYRNLHFNYFNVFLNSVIQIILGTILYIWYWFFMELEHYCHGICLSLPKRYFSSLLFVSWSEILNIYNIFLVFCQLQTQQRIHRFTCWIWSLFSTMCWFSSPYRLCSSNS